MNRRSSRNPYAMTYSAAQYDAVCNDYMHLQAAYDELKAQYTKLNAAHMKLVGTHRNLKMCHANLVYSYDKLDSELNDVEEENRLLNTACKEFAEELDEKNKEIKTLKKKISNSKEKEKKSEKPITDYARLLNMLETGTEIRRIWKIDGINYVFEGWIGRRDVGRSEDNKAFIIANSTKYETIEKWAAAIQEKLVKRKILSKPQEEDIGREFRVHEGGRVYALQILA